MNITPATVNDAQTLLTKQPTFDAEAAHHFVAALRGTNSPDPRSIMGEASAALSEYATADSTFDPATWDDTSTTHDLIYYGLHAGVVRHVGAWDLMWWPQNYSETYDPPTYRWTLDIGRIRLDTPANPLHRIGQPDPTDPRGFAGHAFAVLREAATCAAMIHADLIHLITSCTAQHPSRSIEHHR